MAGLLSVIGLRLSARGACPYPRSEDLLVEVKPTIRAIFRLGAFYHPPSVLHPSILRTAD